VTRRNERLRLEFFDVGAMVFVLRKVIWTVLDSPRMRSVAEIRRFTHEHLEAVLSLCEAEGWPSFPADPERALRVLTAPGVTTVVAIQDEHVVGFAQILSDGEIQAFLANLAVAEGARGNGIGRALVLEALRLAGGERVDLLSEDGATAFYSSFPHFEKPGYRLYPFHDDGDQGVTNPEAEIR
jgi:predicted N-acetyltransferase YhbS